MTETRGTPEEWMHKINSAARSFADKLRGQAGIDVRDLLDPEGDAVGSLVDLEGSAGAAALALPIDLITFETWVLGHVGDRDELDLDVGSHRDLWFSFGAWIGDALRHRHGGFWLFPGEDPHAWHFGFSKILLEIAPHAFAEKLLRAGSGLGRRLLAEIERIREQHVTEAEADGGKPKDRYAPQHYARLHTVPLAQWLVVDSPRAVSLWTKQSARELRAAVTADAKKLPPQNAAIIAKIDETLSKLDPDKPAADQNQERGLYEAIAQIVGLRRATAPVAIDILEKVVLPALHMGIPTAFPPLGPDDIENIKKGNDLFAIMVDVVPYAHQAQEGGFLGTFTTEDMSTPYPDRRDLELGRGDWVAVNAARLRPMLERFDPNKLLLSFEKFVEYASRQPGVPRLAEASRALAETSARAILDIKGAVQAATEGKVLLFRLLPPPA
jgi:hypothetical protein